MASDLILTPAQAQAVYSAMCALNAVGGKLEATVGEVLVRDTFTGRVSVFDADDRRETYDDQEAFADAYDLHQPVNAAPLLKAAERAARRIDWFLYLNPDHVDSTLNVIRQDLRAAMAQATA